VLPIQWDELAKHDIMLTLPYLKALENSLPGNIKLYYIGIFNKEELIGVALVQRVQLYLKAMFKKRFSSAIISFVKDLISRFLKGNVLVIGNLTHTGQHGIAFKKETISPAEYIETLLETVTMLREQIKKESGQTIHIVMLKDYFKNDVIHKAKEVIRRGKFSSVTVQPNMVLSIKSDWNKMDDYVKSLNKKYKARYKRARRRFGDFEKRELDIDAIKKNSERLHSLYSNVSNNAKFNTFILPEHHFYSLKNELRDDFKVFGYYYGNTLIGFYTLILNHDILETYFLGYDSEHQYPNQLYQNMLYDMLDFAISNKFTSVVYARTAMEIKSSIGAEPIDMMMHMKHTNSFANRLLKIIFNFMKPNLKWEKRHPFKS